MVLSFVAWPTGWVSALVWVVLWLYRSEGISFAAWPWARSRLWFGWCSGCTDLAKERRESREKREKFSEEMRGERKNPEEISVCFGGVRADKKWFFNFYKVYSNLSKMKGYCSLCKKI